MEPALLRIQEAAELLKVSKWTVYRWIEEGRLRATKIGRGSLRVFQKSVSGLIGVPEEQTKTMRRSSQGQGRRGKASGR